MNQWYYGSGSGLRQDKAAPVADHDAGL